MFFMRQSYQIILDAWTDLNIRRDASSRYPDSHSSLFQGDLACLVSMLACAACYSTMYLLHSCADMQSSRMLALHRVHMERRMIFRLLGGERR